VLKKWIFTYHLKVLQDYHIFCHITKQCLLYPFNIKLYTRISWQESKIYEIADSTHSKILIILLEWHWTGAKLLNIPDYQMVPIMICL